ncbi:hypothetical protein ACJ8LH_01445 [Serratia sp. CY49633]|uniref:hypothetical protein n=1 Tax=Serratia sp. CY49633 TaxID=3383629 RepID=UPI003FA01E76
MKLYEMEGFLRGKCLPGDLLVGESNAEYLVRKLNEASTLKAERDAQQKRADALAVENVAMREALDSIRIYSSDTLSGPSDSVPDMAAWLREGVEHLHQVSIIETPATDAALAAIQAQGVEKAIERLMNMFASTGHIGIPVMALEGLAKELREAK